MRYNLIALTNPVPGREADFEQWYDKVHLADVLKLPGVTGAQRFRLSAQQYREGPHPWQSMAVYEIETDDMSKTFNALKAASGTEAMPLSDALQDARMVWIYEPVARAGIPS
ncbi:MAG: hypothetical protein CMH66_14595 [Nioella sp.]|nr:hypothetical protein [Nioella sp.]